VIAGAWPCSWEGHAASVRKDRWGSSDTGNDAKATGRQRATGNASRGGTIQQQPRQ